MFEAPPPGIYNGYWLPDSSEKYGCHNVEFAYQTFANGRPVQAGVPGAVTVRWPILEPRQYEFLIEDLGDNRSSAPEGDEFWPRFQAALQHAAGRLANPADALHQQALNTLPAFTGYSPQMIAVSLRAMEWFSLERLPAAFHHPPGFEAMQAWQPFIGMPGQVRFFAQPAWSSMPDLFRRIVRLDAQSKAGLFASSERAQQVVGYGAGNVPGAALLIGLLAQSVVLGGEKPPAVLLRNSRREPIFTPLVFKAMEEFDPELVGTIAVLVWNYEDTEIQDTLLGWADTVIAAAGDDTIGHIRAAIDRAAARRAERYRAPLARPARFQPHGHKVSFAFIGREIAAQGDGPLEKAAHLAALDSSFWDQNGCLSARVHFVEQSPDPEQNTASFYAGCLTAALRRLALTLPRGAWPRRELHERFDRYKSLEAAGLAQVFSGYDDDFLVFIDHRLWKKSALQQVVNDCQGRTIAVRAVADRMEIPRLYLRQMPPGNLQSLSAAVGRPGQALDEDFLRFAEACAQCGVTAIRSVGRGAFPQLPYSWDGYIPYDLIARRVEGRFSTIEFDTPLDEMIETYEMMKPIFGPELT